MPEVFEWESFEEKRRKLRTKESEVFAKIFRLKKKQEVFNKKEQRIISAGLNSLDKLDTLEELEQKKREEETKQKP
jgi:hypothetical protein